MLTVVWLLLADQAQVITSYYTYDDLSFEMSVDYGGNGGNGGFDWEIDSFSIESNYLT